MIKTLLCGRFCLSRVPLQWAQSLNNLGNALRLLGERESGTARLEDAVEAYRSALRGYQRESAPIAWAITQSNLGNALSTLGERLGGTEQLREAVEAYSAALQELTRDRVPLQWAQTQNNLGNVLLVMGEREGGTDRLKEAVAAYQAAAAAAPEWDKQIQASSRAGLIRAVRSLAERGVEVVAD
jgi:tetratricopeptide (TPR) repeat protein